MCRNTHGQATVATRGDFSIRNLVGPIKVNTPLSVLPIFFE